MRTFNCEKGGFCWSSVIRECVILDQVRSAEDFLQMAVAKIVSVAVKMAQTF